MQHAPDRNGQGASDALRIILLQPRDRVAHSIGKDAVNRSAIITEPGQVALQRANVSRLRDQLASRHPVISRARTEARREIGFIKGGAALMQQPPIVARRQDIIRVKKRGIKEWIVVVCAQHQVRGLRKTPTKRESDCNQNALFHNWFTWILSVLFQMADPVAVTAAEVVSLRAQAAGNPGNNLDQFRDRNGCDLRSFGATCEHSSWSS